MGACVYTCETGWGDCTAAPGCETDLGTAKAHCGACGNACAAFCKAGSCNDPVSVAGGYHHHCAVLKDGEVYCWGRNEKGEVGIDAPILSKTPVKVTLPAPGTATQVDGGGNFGGTYNARNCAILTGGSVACWGDGNGAPAKVSGLANIKQISVGNSHTCAVDTGGKLYCWGGNSDGQVGAGDTGYKSLPVQISTNVAYVSAGGIHTCALKNGGSLQCWGDNARGQLGINSTTDQLVPTTVPNIVSAEQLQCGQDHTCARDGSDIYCWGANIFGSLGINSYEQKLTPQLVNLAGTQTIALGFGNTGTIVASSVWMWGNNSAGKLGNGNQANQPKPVQIGLSGAAALALAGSSTCALLTDGSISCWGDNTYGQLGNGTTVSSSTPTAVVWP
ncbi:hypothetical protein [Polyangium sp. y55x31]|uniref:RCC1 domain-containing protein n=1 Tax=Polyangium sp. y55x31 TaxID=3042688 RepID=UPI0024824BE5|nr:hypothetical protein [Polyangium sp. y55x31]MDI1479861.1 hypothetical protein [Polyangium sp. y55x31]